jgi:methionyl-tRNA formyltransferase
MGSPPFAGPVFEAVLACGRHEVQALVTRPDKPRGRGMKVAESPLVLLARERGVRVLQPAKARDPEFVATLRALAPDVMLVASYGEILKQDVLDVPRHGCLNVHASLLPRHRGASPIQAAVLAGDAETGVAIQRMVLALDEGDIVVLERTPIGAHETSGELFARLAVLGGAASVKALDQLQDGSARFTPQDPAQATFARKIAKEHGTIDWSLPASEIDRRVRAFTPWPGARTTAPNGTELGVLDVRVRQDVAARAEPGTIVATKPALVVACGQDALEIRALKPAGKGRMDAAAWLNGARVEAGARLGAPAPAESAEARHVAPQREIPPQRDAASRTNTAPPRTTTSDAHDTSAKPPTKER